MFFIESKGRMVKMSGFPIKRVPAGKVLEIRDFHIVYYNESNTYKIVRYGEISLVPNDTYHKECILDVMHCTFESK